MSVLVGRRILVVEDEPIIAFAIEDMLTDLGCQVVGPAFNLSEAEQLAAEALLDAAILDVNLNDQRSYSAAAVLLGRRIPFIFATGYGEDRVDWDHGGALILAKPYRQDQVAAALTLLLG